MDNFSLQKPLNMAPTGIATFAKTDLAPDIYNLNADIAVLGAPFDLAIQGRTGCRLGPRAFVWAPPGSPTKKAEPTIRNGKNSTWIRINGKWWTAGMRTTFPGI